MSGKAIEKEVVLFSEMTPEAAWEEEFNSWYTQEHIPLRMNVPGFGGAQRYRVPDETRYLVVYEMANSAVLDSDPYQAVKRHPSERTAWMLSHVKGFTRYIGKQIGAPRTSFSLEAAFESPILYAVFFQVPDEREQEFNEWYEVDHVTTLLECPDWVMVRRFRINGEPEKWTHLALHYLARKEALDSPERTRARASPWRARLSEEPWFRGHYAIFEKYGPRFAPSSRNANSRWT